MTIPQLKPSCGKRVGDPMKFPYNKEIGDEICRLLSTTTQSLDKICLTKGYPCASTVQNWRHQHPQFNEQYIEARKRQVELNAEEIIEIADDDKNDFYIDDRGNNVPNPINVRRAELRIKARHIAFMRMNHLYGAKDEDDGEKKNLELMRQLVQKCMLEN